MKIWLLQKWQALCQSRAKVWLDRAERAKARLAEKLRGRGQ
jgi:hypothetical protein